MEIGSEPALRRPVAETVVAETTGEQAVSSAPFVRCVQCGAAAGEVCRPGCPALDLSGRCPGCFGVLAVRGEEAACFHCDPETVAAWQRELEDHALTAAELGCYHRGGDQVFECSNPECPGRVVQVDSDAAARALAGEPEPEPEPPPTLSSVLQPAFEAAERAAAGFGVLVIVFAPDGSYRLGGRDGNVRQSIGLLFSAASSLDRRLGEAP